MTRGSSSRTPWACAPTLACALVGLATTQGRAHVGPSTDRNNRYLKIELRARELRLATTIYLGELPGAQQRRRLDGDRDGVISEAEAQVFGEALRDQVGAELGVDVDGVRATAWTLVEVGLGTRATTGGAFSVDLELRVPLGAASEHVLRLVDRLSLPSPGEAEVRVEPAPGVTVLSAGSGGDSTVTLEETSDGAPLPPVRVRWRTPPPPAGAHATTPASALPWYGALGVLGVLGAAAGTALAWRRRARRRQDPGEGPTTAPEPGPGAGPGAGGGPT